MLSITDVLTRNLIKATLTYDARKSRIISNVLKRQKLLKSIRECGVGFQIYLEEDGGSNARPYLEVTKKITPAASKKIVEMPTKNFL